MARLARVGHLAGRSGVHRGVLLSLVILAGLAVLRNECPALAYGEELVYPDISMPIPAFVTDEHKAFWLAHATAAAENRFVLVGERAHYLAQHGQTLVLRNVTFKNDPPTDSWAPQSCMAADVSARGLVPLPPGTPPKWRGRAVLANTPDSWSYQHFMDRVTKMLMQTEPWRQAGTRVVGGMAPQSEHVKDLWAALLQEGGQQEEVHGAAEFSVEELVFGCRTPMIHPYHSARLRELLKLPEPAPLEQRKTVLYLSRGSEARERRVANEDALLEGIRGLLRERGKGEEVVVFDKAKFPSMRDVINFFASNVSAVVGPHGGAWYNAMFWAAPDTLMLEFLPKQRFGVMVWEEAGVMGARVWVLLVDSKDSQHTMEVDPGLVVPLLAKQLGAAVAAEEPRLFYRWNGVDLVHTR